MGPTLKRYVVAAGIACAAGLATGAVEAATEGEKVGDTQMCVSLMTVDQTPVIDNKTILIKMKAKGQFKRIDLMSSCPGLDTRGFAFGTSINQLCTSDPLKVIEPVGATCMIKQIVNITPEEAKELQSKDHKKKQ